jgi:hypothetical protein
MDMRTAAAVVAPSERNSAGAHRGFFARIRRAFGLEAPSREEIRQRIRSKPGIIESLSPEALEYLRSYDGPEVHGPPLTKRERRDLERCMAARDWN